MRVHRVEITAFGPFADTQVIDFEPLNAAGVFLLTGPTGAGKTSILDAICFGLFGQVPGVRDRAKAYASHHAGAGTAPRIVLDVTLRGRRLRLTRHAAWSRPSRRARSGSVEEKARAGVEECLDDGWVTRSTRVDEVGHLVTELLGLNRDQFCQVVMLAQGEFQTFLRAGGRDRQHVLESLFGTQRFQAVERWLVEHRRLQGRRYRDCEEQVAQVVARLREVCSPLRATENFALPEGNDDWEKLGAAARQLVGAGHQAAATAAEELGAAMASCKRAQHAYDEARRCADLRERHSDALRRHDELVATKAVVAARAERICRARAADALLPLVQLATDTDEALTRTARTAADVRSRCAAVPAIVERCGAAPTTRQVAQVIHELCSRQSQLTELARIEVSCDELVSTIRAELRAREALAARLAILREEVSDNPGRVAGKREQVADLEKIVDRSDDAEARVRHAKNVLSAAQEVASLDAERSELDAHRLRAREIAVDAAEKALVARERLLAGMAAELAGGLAPDQPCPVCGSRVHPEAAVPSEAHVTGQEEAELHASATAAHAVVTDLERQIVENLTAQGHALSRSGGLSIARAKNLIVDARRDRTQAASAVAAVAELTQELQSILEGAGELQQKLESAMTQLAAMDERLSVLSQRLQRERTRLAREVGPGVRVAGLLSQVSEHLDLCSRLETVTRQHDEARRAKAQARRRFQSALDESDFGDATGVAAAVLPQTEIAALEALNRAHDSELDACLRTLADPAVGAAAAGPPPDLAALQAAAVASNAAAVEAGTVAAAAERRQARLEELVAELALGVSELSPLREAKELADEVASLCSGSSSDNATRTTLSNYVLAARLAQVVAAANARLDAICSGRYQLEHTMARGAGDSRGGLGLVVQDTHTDRSRDPVTLSGGETFYVSLSLALGLADVVTSEVGGAELFTLFVDEGFGGLDDDTRDEVLDELDALRSGGRSIGLVSHLSELRARIPVQLHVQAGPGGSTCRPVTTA